MRKHMQKRTVRRGSRGGFMTATPTPNRSATPNRSTTPTNADASVSYTCSSLPPYELAAALPTDHIDDFINDYHWTNVLVNKNTASDSVIAFGQHRRTKVTVAVKLYWQSSDDFEKLQYEAQMYQQVNTVRLCNTVRFIGQIRIPWNTLDTAAVHSDENTLLLICDELKHLFSSSYLLFKKATDRNESVFGTITEYRPAVKSLEFMLTDLHKDRKADLTYVKALLFQVVFTLAAMQTAGLQHNDLHVGNILVDRQPVASSLRYSMQPGLHFTVPLQQSGQVLLFDWDLGVCQACGVNHFLDKESFCKSYGVCNTLNPRFDIYTLLRYMQGVVLNAEFQAFVQYAIGSTPLKEPFFGRMCNDVNIGTLVAPKDMKKGSYYQIMDKAGLSYYQQWRDWFKKDLQVGDVFEAKPNGSVNSMSSSVKLKEIVCAPFPTNMPATVRTPAELLLHPFFAEFQGEEPTRTAMAMATVKVKVKVKRTRTRTTKMKRTAKMKVKRLRTAKMKRTKTAKR